MSTDGRRPYPGICRAVYADAACGVPVGMAMGLVGVHRLRLSRWFLSRPALKLVRPEPRCATGERITPFGVIPMFLPDGKRSSSNFRP